MYIELIGGGRNSQHSMLNSLKEVLNDKIIYNEYYEHLCYHFCYFSIGLLPDVQIEYMDNVIRQLLHYSIQQYHDEKFRHLCENYCIYLSVY